MLHNPNHIHPGQRLYGWRVATIRMNSENLDLKRTVRDQGTEVRSLADKLATAREYNRFADRRIADLEACIAEPQLGQGNGVGQHSANGEP